jgi:hypothetical protein
MFDLARGLVDRRLDSRIGVKCKRHGGATFSQTQ